MFDNANDISMNYHDEKDGGLIGKGLSDRENLEKSAAEKCQLCLPLWNRILEKVKEGLMDPNSNICRVMGGGPHRFPDLESSVILWPQDGSEDTESSVSSIKSETPHDTEEVPSLDLVPTSRWPQIFEWMRGCEREHSRCPKLGVNDASMWYPTRLLEVPTSGDSIKLAITSLERPSSAYLTLSHRWGTESIVTLTAENITEFVNGIQVASLPKTFQDAITVSRQLGIRYLWIDSLCILQSGEGASDDWNRESITMHQVYGNAYCNITATSAADPNTGLFLDLPAEVDPPATVTMNFNGKNGHPDFIGDYTVINSDLWATIISRSPLMRRAWVFQERMLAPRVLHFTSSQMFWECCMQQACETFADGLPDFSQAQLDRVFRPATRTSFWKQLQDEPLGHEVAHYRNHHDLWASVVEDYSRCQLTVEGDKLVALSGIAQCIAGFHKRSDYLAGNWREDFPFCLLWCSEPRPDAAAHSFRPAAYRAPSWSWASFEGAIMFAPGPFDSGKCDVLDISILPTPLNGTKTDAISSITRPVETGSSITLVGHMISANWVPEDWDTYERFEIAGKDDIKGYWYPDETQDLDDHYDSPNTVGFFCFVIDGGLTVNGDSFLAGITLEKIEEGERSQENYRRMGYFTLFGDRNVEVVLMAQRRQVVIL